MTPAIAKQLIRKKGISYAAASREIGVSRSTLYRYLRSPESIDSDSIRHIIAWVQANGGLAMDDRTAWESLDAALLALLPDALRRQIVMDLIVSLRGA